jgi:DNA-binding CsgD family transcriptional regulator/tetratricopeptide (TPR) repeat protein
MAAGGGDAIRFVGRERELEAVLEAAAGAAAGRSGVVLVEASSGLGATRLVDEVERRLAEGQPDQTPPVMVRADELPAWRGSPYAPFRVALERLLVTRTDEEAASLLGPGAELLLPLLPRTAARLGARDRAPATRELLADRIREAVRGVFGRLAGDGPVVLVLEDLHVLDAASRSLLAFLARTLGDRPILVVGTYQPEALGRGHPLRSTLEAIASGPRPVRRLSLPPLDRSALRSLIAAHEGAPPSAPVLLLVAERSGGSPLLAEEVLAARRELSGASLSVPLEQLVVSRAATRSAECRRVLRTLSIVDGPLEPAELGAVAAAYDAELGRRAPRSTGRPRRRGDGVDGDLAAGVAEAIAHGFVEVLAGADEPRLPSRSRIPTWPSRPADRPIRIRHELLAAALRADLLPGPRRRMHAATAAALAEHAPEAGGHWHEAHEGGRELLAEIEAADRARQVGAAADELGHLESAIELVGAPVAAGVVGPEMEFDLLVRAAEASSAAGDVGRAEAFDESAIARLSDQNDRRALAELTERLGSYRLLGGDREGAVAAFERALELLPVEPGVTRARLLAMFAQVRMLEGSFTEATALAEQALEAAGGAGPDGRPWRGHALCTMGVVDGWLGRTGPSIERLEEALAIAIDEGRLDDAFRARANLATMLDLEGRRDEAVAVSRRGIEAAEAAGLEVVHGNLLRGSAVDALVTLGRWGEARAMAERALDWAPSGIPFVNAALGLAIIETETAAGEAATRLLGKLFLELETIPDVQFAVPAYQAAASLALWRGDLADAQREIDEAWSRVRDSEDWVIGARTAAAALAVADARARAALDRRDLATVASARAYGDDVLRQANRIVEASGVPADAWSRREAEADLATARAFAARIHGRDEPEAWERTAAAWRAVRRPYEVARALHHQVEAHLEAGAGRAGRDEARAPLLEAAAIAADLGALPLLRSLADLAGRARIPLEAGPLAALAAADVAASPPAEERPPAPRPERARRGPAAGSDRTTAASFGLSPRELGVLAEIVAGRTNREIGERLFISEKTVGVHVGNILAKLGVGGRVEAATVSLRLGLVEDVPQRTRKPGPGGPGFGSRRRGGAA